MALFYTIRRLPCSQCLQNQECTVQNTVLESKEEEEQTVVVVLKLTLLGLGLIKINDVSANLNNHRPLLILNN